MSRSYKRVPGWSDYSRNRTKFEKRMAAKAVRRNADVPQGGGFRKAYCSYDIRDWHYRYWTEGELRRYCEWRGELPYKARMK